MVDDWRLTDGFVAEEGKVLLPNLATIRPNLVENHTALLLAAWIRAGILDVSSFTRVLNRVSNDLGPKFQTVCKNCQQMTNKQTIQVCSCMYDEGT